VTITPGPKLVFDMWLSASNFSCQNFTLSFVPLGEPSGLLQVNATGGIQKASTYALFVRDFWLYGEAMLVELGFCL